PLGEAGEAGALHRVVGHDADVVALARRVVDARLIGPAAAGRLRQADERVAGRDHRDAATRRLVEDRDLDRGAARVVGPDHADHIRIGGVLLRVRAAQCGLPLRGLRERVVAGLEGHRHPGAGLPAPVVELLDDRDVHLSRALGRVALQRQVGDDHIGWLAGALVLARAYVGIYA